MCLDNRKTAAGHVSIKCFRAGVSACFTGEERVLQQQACSRCLGREYFKLVGHSCSDFPDATNGSLQFSFKTVLRPYGIQY